MLTSTVIAGTDIVAIDYGGRVRTEEMLDACEEVDAVVGTYGAARLLVVYDHLDPTRWEPRAMWSDLLTARVLGDVDRVAVVADADWIDDLDGVDADGRWIPAKGFRTDRRDDARAWLQTSR
jgi:hypothetical protein